MPQKLKFQEGEQILCYHGPLLYEAKCIKVEVKDKVVKYLIHYSGWNKNWDEWVLESRILKLNEAGLQKQKDLQVENSSKNRASRLKEKEFQKEREREFNEGRIKSGSKPPTPQPTVLTSVNNPLPIKYEKKSKIDKKEEEKVASIPVEKPGVSETNVNRKKRNRQSETGQSNESMVSEVKNSESSKKKRPRVDSYVETEESYKTKTEVVIRIQSNLKPWLVDDWDLITRQRQIVDLPCKITVSDILNDYQENNNSNRQDALDKETVSELCNGLREYFDVMLGAQLLYKVERPQYSEILKKFPEKSPSDIYGAFHFLRLFVKIGGLLSYSALDEKSIALLISYIQHVLRFISQSSSKYFRLEDYIVAPPEHHRKAL